MGLICVPMIAATRANSHRMATKALAGRLGAWATGSGPLYRQLAEAIGELIGDGELHRDDQLPPERPFAAELAVSRGTVAAAYERLQEMGLVSRRQGSGTRVSGTDMVAAPPSTKLIGGPLFERVPRAIDLLKAIPAIAPRVELIAADGSILPPPGWSDTVEPAGLLELRSRIADRYERDGLPTSPEQILVSSGAQQGLLLSLSLLVTRGDIVICEFTTWPGLTDTIRRLGGRIHAVGMDDHGLDVDELRSAVQRLRPACIAINPHHHNPTGTRLAPDRRAEVVDIAGDYGVPLIEDRVVAPLAFDRNVPPPLAALRPDANTFVVDSLSKTAWAGLRIGWVRADQQAIHQLRSLKTLDDQMSSLPSQMLAIAIVDELEEIIAERIDQLRGRATVLGDAVADRLPDWTTNTVRGGLVTWSKLPFGSASAFARFATRFGVAVAGGREFSSAQTIDDHIRIPFTARETTLVEAVDRLAAAWADFADSPDVSAEPDLRSIV